jgi:hypothetical protein
VSDDGSGPVLVIVDGSEVGWHALGMAAARAISENRSLICAAITPPRLERGRTAHFDPESHLLDSEFADMVLGRAAEQCRERDVPATTVRLLGRPVSAVVDEVRSRSVAAIYVGRRPPLAGFALPDFSEQLTAATGIKVEAVELPPRALPTPARPPAG